MSVIVGRKVVGRHVVGIVCQHQQEGWLVRRIVVQWFVLAHGMRGRDTLLLSVTGTLRFLLTTLPQSPL